MNKLMKRITRLYGWTAPALVAFGYSMIIAGASVGGMNGPIVQKFGLPVVFIGVSGLVVGVAWMIARALKTRAWASDTERGTIGMFSRSKGPGQLPRPGDVQEVIYHATKNIDAELFYSEEQMQQYLAVNPGALRVLRNDASAKTRLTGYYILLGISRRAEELIGDGSIDAGVALAPTLTVHDPGEADALYLGMIQGFGRGGKDGAIVALIEHVVGIVGERHGRPVRVYARRGHPSSGALMDAMGFKPVVRQGGIEVAEVPNPELDELYRRRLTRIE